MREFVERQLRLHEANLVEDLSSLRSKGRRKGFFILVPWMLLGTVWLRVNTGLDPGTVDFYFSLLVAGAISLLIGMYYLPSFASELGSLKLLPFVLFFGVAMGLVFITFAGVSVLKTGALSSTHHNASEFANFLALTILIVAPVETLVFQFILPKLMTLTLYPYGLAALGGVLAQVAFGGFHYVAYSHNLISMGAAIILGVGFYTVVRSSDVWGLGAGMGLHAGWNISVTVIAVAIASGVWTHISQALGGML